MSENTDMQTVPGVSVIMPVYNSKRYLPLAVQSVLAQTYQDFELILVDDGSSDESAGICDTFARQDGRVRVIHKQNGGICSARNAGLDAAQGLYIAFIDNDDTYDREMLSLACGAMEKEKVDWVRFSRKRCTIYEDGTVQEDSNGVKGIAKEGETVVLRGDALRAKYRLLKEAGALYGIWNALFRRELIEQKGIRFDESVRCGGEDWLFNLQYLGGVSSTAFLNRDLYIYNRRIFHSTSAKYNFNRIEAVQKVAKLENGLVRSMRLEDCDRLIRIYLFALSCSECAKIMQHPDCDLKYSEKVSILTGLKQELLGGRKRPLSSAFRLLAQNKKKGLSAVLLSLRCYRLFLILSGAKLSIKREF